jgi:membrane-associated phospholipid phosphatase
MILFAKIISWFASPPVILLTTPFLLVDSVAKNDIYALKWTAFSFVFVCIVVLFVAVGVFFGIFSNMAISNRKQRPIVFLFSTILLAIYSICVIILNGPKILLFASLFMAFCFVILDLINIKIKASIHIAAVSSFIFLFSLAYGAIFLLLSVPLVFLIGWSRLKLKRHTKSEVLLGGFLGVIMTIVFYIASKQFLG